MDDYRTRSSKFYELREEIINWNKFLTAFQDGEYNISEARENARKAALLISGNTPGKQLNVSGATLEWVRNCNPSSNLYIFYIHGGGFIAGSLDNHRPFAKQLSKKLNANILMADYPLAPEFPYPKPLISCFEGLKFFLESAEQSSVLGLMGDSAGANLCLASMLKLRDENFFRLPDFAVFLSGFFDLSMNSPSIFEKKDEDIVLTPEFIKLSSRSYAGEENLQTPYISPVYGNLSGLPDLFFQVGSSEILLDDSIRCHNRAVSFDVNSKISIWPEMMHSFQCYHKCIPEALKAMEEINGFIESITYKPVLT